MSLRSGPVRSPSRPTDRGGVGQWASIEPTSRPKSPTVVAPARSAWKKACSLVARAWPAARHALREEAGMATTPSTSATSQSPAATGASPSTMAPPVAPGPVFEAPRNPTPRANTGKRCLSRAPTSRTVPSTTRPTIPAASAAVVRTSPQYPRSVSPPIETAKTDPRGARATAACMAKLSPGAQATVKAGPATAAPAQTARIRACSGTPPLSPKVAEPSDNSCSLAITSEGGAEVSISSAYTGGLGTKQGALGS
jgi:hypothetical protein